MRPPRTAASEGMKSRDDRFGTSSRPWRFGMALLLATLVLPADVHPSRPGDNLILLQKLERADLAAVATVDAIEEGYVALRLIEVVKGEAGTDVIRVSKRAGGRDWFYAEERYLVIGRPVEFLGMRNGENWEPLLEGLGIRVFVGNATFQETLPDARQALRFVADYSVAVTTAGQIAVLRSMLEADNYMARVSACAILSRRKDVESSRKLIPVLFRLAHSDNGPVSGRATELFAAYISRGAKTESIPQLIDLLDTPHASSLSQTKYALKNLTGREVDLSLDSPMEKRRAVKAEWRKWWKQHKEEFSDD